MVVSSQIANEETLSDEKRQRRERSAKEIKEGDECEIKEECGVSNNDVELFSPPSTSQNPKLQEFLLLCHDQETGNESTTSIALEESKKPKPAGEILATEYLESYESSMKKLYKLEIGGMGSIIPPEIKSDERVKKSEWRKKIGDVMAKVRCRETDNLWEEEMMNRSIQRRIDSWRKEEEKKKKRWSRSSCECCVRDGGGVVENNTIHVVTDWSKFEIVSRSSEK